MPSWKNPLKRHSITISEAPIDEERCGDPDEFRLPTNLKNLKLQDSEPQSLPSADANMHAVRFFLYHVLTFRGNKVAKRWPQWVLETVSYWKGDGRALRALEGDLTHLCPMSASYAHLDYKVAPESSPSGDCRTHIGLVLSTKIKKLKENESRAAKAHEEWRATQQGYMHPWNQSRTDQLGSTSTHSFSQFRRQASVTSAYPQARLSNTMSDLRSMYNAHATFTPTPSHHAPSIAIPEYAIPRARSMVPLQREFSSAVAYSSSTESQRASRDCSSGTSTIDSTSVPHSPESVVNGAGEQLLVTPPLVQDDSLNPDEDLFDAVSTVSTTHSTRERSSSASSYGSSQYTAPEESYPRNLSSPSRYRGGTLRTVGTLPPLDFGMNVPHSGIYVPRDGRSSVASTYSPAVNATPLGLVCGQGPVPRPFPVPPHMPSHPSPTPYRLSYAQNPRKNPTQRQYVPTVDAFTGPHRSTNTASWDIVALEKGSKFILDEKKRQTHGVSSQSRRRPAYIPPKLAEDELVVEPSTRIMNPEMGRHFMTLYERIQDLERMGAQK
ncbi:hypothetical protein P171DRAFT_446875 [Karstenula rhodostoma CBS 690.94]|uniref:Uncharacterized protein n=1 Tax=Karstenula rhodostoma CBS 690.94 TaxID=1392251 RepID=A0A9P4PBM1_9PLEO|nr:hypothetical protein P171DRAFT_446875 [Karstenula rhodostoma CBS 690.94]